MCRLRSRQRAQRGALKTLALVPVPSSLLSLFGGGGGAAVGTGLTLKAAAALTAGWRSAEQVTKVCATYRGRPRARRRLRRRTVSAELPRRAMPLSRREERHASRPAPGLVVTRPRRRASNRRRPRHTAAQTSRHWHERTRASLPTAGVRSSPAEPAAGGARVHPTTRVKPKDLRLPARLASVPRTGTARRSNPASSLMRAAAARIGNGCLVGSFGRKEDSWGSSIDGTQCSAGASGRSKSFGKQKARAAVRERASTPG